MTILASLVYWAGAYGICLLGAILFVATLDWIIDR